MFHIMDTNLHTGPTIPILVTAAARRDSTTALSKGLDGRNPIFACSAMDWTVDSGQRIAEMAPSPVRILLQKLVLMFFPVKDLSAIISNHATQS